MTPQQVIDLHYRTIVDTLMTGNEEKISFLVACLNFLKGKAGFEHINLAAQEAVTRGWLTINDANRFMPRQALQLQAAR